MTGNSCILENGLHISIDWLSFTIKEVIKLHEVVTMFGFSMEDFQIGLNGSYGYKSRIRHSEHSISILYDGNENMGLHVDVSGSAVGYFIDSYRKKHTDCPTPFGNTAYTLDSFDCTIFSDMLQAILDIGHLTRLDIAIDDIGCNYFSMDDLTDIFNDGLYLSKFKKWKLNIEKSKWGTTGHSIYLGSRTSEIMFRIYDKKLERNAKKNVKPITVPWVRWEIELHKNRATAIAMFLISGNDLSSVAIGVLSSYLRLVNRDNKRDSRCSTSEKWTSFINGIQKIRICQPVSEKTLEEKKAWVLNQVAPTFAAIYQIDGCFDFFYDVIKKGSVRISKELMRIIERENNFGIHQV